jgi:hypothetical protein
MLGELTGEEGVMTRSYEKGWSVAQHVSWHHGWRAMTGEAQRPGGLGSKRVKRKKNQLQLYK